MSPTWYVAIDTGGTGWATVLAANAAQLRDGLVGQGATATATGT